MRVARLADARVLLVGDIDRGGVFAALVGTLALLDPADRARVAGLIVNKLRGDGSILTPGRDGRAARTGVPVLGVVPWINERLVPAEDSLDLEALALGDGSTDAIEIAVVRLPRIANFDDFEPLAAEPGVRVRFATTPAALRAADLVVLPGSKSTMADLVWLQETGLAAAGVAGGSEVRRWAPRPFTIVERCGAAVDDREGAMGARGNVVGTYRHGLFADAALRRSLLCLLAELRGRPAHARWGAPDADRYERLADIVGGALDMPAIAKLAGLPFPRA